MCLFFVTASIDGALTFPPAPKKLYFQRASFLTIEHSIGIPQYSGMNADRLFALRYGIVDVFYVRLLAGASADNLYILYQRNIGRKLCQSIKPAENRQLSVKEKIWEKCRTHSSNLHMLL